MPLSRLLSAPSSRVRKEEGEGREQISLLTGCSCPPQRFIVTASLVSTGGTLVASVYRVLEHSSRGHTFGAAGGKE